MEFNRCVLMVISVIFEDAPLVNLSISASRARVAVENAEWKRGEEYAHLVRVKEITESAYNWQIKPFSYDAEIDLLKCLGIYFLYSKATFEEYKNKASEISKVKSLILGENYND